MKKMKTENKNEDSKYKILNHREHILLRPQTYVGSNKPNTSVKFYYDDKLNKIVKNEITFIPSFIKLFDEIISNSVDEHKRNPKLNKIDIVISDKKDYISIYDNGGIPVKIHSEYGIYIPEVIFGNLMSGSNYDDTQQREVVGVNGLGSKLSNIFSNKFIISTCDGDKSFEQTFTNNMGERTEPIIKKSKKNHTKITYYPDFSRFNMDKIDDDHYRMLVKRIVDLVGINPNILFTLNGKEISFNGFENYMKLYDKCENIIYEQSNNKNWFIGICNSSDGFQQVSFTNCSETYDGGTHVDYVVNQITSNVREHMKKKYKVDVKNNEIKNHLFLFVNTTIINPSFSSQTKEKLITEVKDFGTTHILSDKFYKELYKSEIIKSILDWVDKKKNADENKLERELNKTIDKLKVDKLIDAKSKDRGNCSLFIFEGESASGGFRKYRDTNLNGAFCLRGKFINATELTNKKLLENEEVLNLIASIGLKVGKKAIKSELRYGKIYIYCDADHDGSSIIGLLINFLFRYWPELFNQGMVYIAETPIVVVLNKKSKDKKLFYDEKDYNAWLNKNNPKLYEIEYKKGLGALLDDEYSNIIKHPKLIKINSGEKPKESLDVWFGKDAELRKIELLK